MGLGDSVRLIKGHWAAVLAFVLVGIIGGAGYVLLSTPHYTAQAELFLAVENGSSTQDLNQGSTYAQQQARNYSALATREIVLEPVITALDLTTTPRQLSRQISTSVPLNTSLITVAVTDDSPQRASAIANAVAISLSNEVVKLVPTRRDGTSPVRLDTVQPAVVPIAPSSPGGLLVIVFAGLGGLVAGIAVVLIRERVSAKVRSTEQLKDLDGITVLGAIGYDRRAVISPMLRPAENSPRAESFRQLRTNVRFLQTDVQHKAFVVTSSISGEGKSTSAANLAASLAASGASVCLVEADLRRPVLHHYLDLEGGVGLTSVITNDATLDEALQSWGPHGLKVLLAGDLPPNPSELLGSHQAETVLRELNNRFDVTIIDCPPVLPVTDAALVAKSLGGAIMVVGSGRVEVRDFRRAVEALETAGAPLLGVVLNYAPQAEIGQYRRMYRRDEHVQWDASAAASGKAA